MVIPPDRIETMAKGFNVGRDPASVRRRLEAMETLLEKALVVPGTRFGFGLDAIVGLVPVLGDIVTASMGAWLIWEGRNLGMSRFQLWRMAGNVGVDTILGFVPGLGDAFDLLFRSNSRNMRIIRRWLDKHHPETGIIEGEVTRR